MSAPAHEQVNNPNIADLDPVLIVEAALFSAGKTVSVEEIAENTGLAKGKVSRALEKLQKRYAEGTTSLEIGRAGEKWGMQVQTRYAPSTVRLAPMEIAIKLLKTLALIAYHQPILQSDLKEMVGDKVYDHIRELKEVGLVKKRTHERSYLIVTTDRFPEYFGIPASDREGIKTFLAEKVGLELPKADTKGNRKLNTFPGKAAPAAPAAPDAAPDAVPAAEPEAEAAAEAAAESDAAPANEPADAAKREPVDDAAAQEAPADEDAAMPEPEKVPAIDGSHLVE